MSYNNKKNNKIETIIGLNSSINGKISVDGTIRIDGKIEGDIKADRVVIGAMGQLEGNIDAYDILVGGTIKGSLKAESTVEINSKGKIYGDIKTEKLIILEGGIFEGKSDMKPIKEQADSKANTEKSIQVLTKQEAHPKPVAVVTTEV